MGIIESVTETNFACSLCKVALVVHGLWAMNFYWASFTGLSKWKAAWAYILKHPRSANNPTTNKLTISGGEKSVSEMGEVKWGWLTVSGDFYRLAWYLSEFLTQWGLKACLLISSHFHLDFCQQSGNFQDEHVLSLLPLNGGCWNDV